MLSLQIKEAKAREADGSLGAGGGGLSAAFGNMKLQRRNTLDMSSKPPTPTAEPRGFVDYLQDNERANRDYVEGVPRSLEQAIFTPPSRVGSFFAAESPMGSLPTGSLQSNFLSADTKFLPEPMLPAEREKKIREAKQTPTFELVRKVNKLQHLMHAATDKGQTLRRQLLSGAVVVIICAGYSGKRFIYERAKELGVRLVIIDGPDSWSQTLVEDGVIEKFMPLDMSDPGAVFHEAVKLLKEIDAESGGIDGICTFWEVAVPLVARLAESLGLPGNPSLAVDTARDKYLTRKALEEADLPTPSSCMIYCKEDIPKAASAVGFPAVIKPVNGAASLGVVKVSSMEDLTQAYAKVMDIMSTCSVSDPHGTSGQGGNAFITEVMMEQYLDGDEVDVDIILSDGAVTYAKVTDNLPTLEPWFNETGACTPSLLPESKQDELVETSSKMLRAVGLTTGVMHVELKYTTTNGPQLIEINGRMGGGPVRDMNLAVWGVDLVEEQLMASVGLPACPPLPEKPIKCLGQYVVCPFHYPLSLLFSYSL